MKTLPLHNPNKPTLVNTPSSLSQKKTNRVDYEYASNESMRLCLWLENILTRIHASTQADQYDRIPLSLLINLLEITHRPDLKSRLIKMLKLSIQNLLLPEVSQAHSQNTIASISAEINRLTEELGAQPGKLSDALNDNQFLQMIRLQKNGPAGLCETNLAPYHFWLNQTDAQKKTNLKHWLKHFALLEAIITSILAVSRLTGHSESINISDGFYQENLLTSKPYQLIQIQLPPSLEAYPEISFGKHRLIIRFVTMDIEQGSRPKQLEQALTIKLSKFL